MRGIRQAFPDEPDKHTFSDASTVSRQSEALRGLDTRRPTTMRIPLAPPEKGLASRRTSPLLRRSNEENSNQNSQEPPQDLVAFFEYHT